ncbi:nucleotidyltransferase family protein [Ottowia testudinis]|uniref:Nucleotidyltransferase family protein n=1 Tax=Ottowia testudinis TaxID=2816950 RepID=A0A975H227_9BURK|nr:nucleotidyltransferase family protein [Ottowia testudinis]QTD43756.1 nucleotidyltransferase family protein [Ottowia testudinis]
MPQNAPEIVAGVVLAAGAGRRMGFKPKALLRRDGQPLMARQIGLLAQCGVRRIVVVLGHHAEQVVPVLAATAAELPVVDLTWVVNPAPDEGTGASLRCALAALPAGLVGVLVLLSDQPLLQAGDVAAVLAAWRARPAGIDLVLPTHNGQPGHPLVFGTQVRQAASQSRGGAGVREWRRAHPGQVLALTVDHPRCTLDIDTEDDLARLATEFGVGLSWPETDLRP